MFQQFTGFNMFQLPLLFLLMAFTCKPVNCWMVFIWNLEIFRLCASGGVPSCGSCAEVQEALQAARKARPLEHPSWWRKKWLDHGGTYRNVSMQWDIWYHNMYIYIYIFDSEKKKTNCSRPLLVWWENISNRWRRWKAAASRAVPNGRSSWMHLRCTKENERRHRRHTLMYQKHPETCRNLKWLIIGAPFSRWLTAF